MTKESNLELFDKWTETKDRATYIELGEKLFPGEMTRQEWEKQADEALAGYQPGYRVP